MLNIESNALVGFALVLGITGCSGTPDGTPVTPTAAVVGTTGDAGTLGTLGNGPGGPPSWAPAAPVASPGTGPCPQGCTAPVGSDPADIGQVLAAALQEEHRAEGLYRSVLEDFGAGTYPFAPIADAERTHVGALTNLFTRRQLVPPASAWPASAFAPFPSLAAACAAGVTAEVEDAAFYTPYLQRQDLPADVANVFTKLQAASLQNHLPAFQRCQ